jgi:hypothetical protein
MTGHSAISTASRQFSSKSQCESKKRIEINHISVFKIWTGQVSPQTRWSRGEARLLESIGKNIINSILSLTNPVLSLGNAIICLSKSCLCLSSAVPSSSNADRSLRRSLRFVVWSPQIGETIHDWGKDEARIRHDSEQQIRLLGQNDVTSCWLDSMRSKHFSSQSKWQTPINLLDSLCAWWTIVCDSIGQESIAWRECEFSMISLWRHWAVCRLSKREDWIWCFACGECFRTAWQGCPDWNCTRALVGTNTYRVGNKSLVPSYLTTCVNPHCITHTIW